MTLSGQIITTLIALLPLVFFADFMLSKDKSTLTGDSSNKKMYFGTLYLLMVAGAGYLANSAYKNGQGAWVKVYDDNMHHWILDLAVADYLKFVETTFSALTTGIYHVAYMGLSKLPILDDIFANDGYWAADITNRILLFVVLTPLFATAITMIRRIIFQVQLSLANNSILQEQLSAKYDASGWFRMEIMVLKWLFLSVELLMTTGAAIFTVMILAPLAANSATLAIATVSIILLAKGIRKYKIYKRATLR